MAVYIEGHAESLVTATAEGSAGVDKLAASTERLSATQATSAKGFASYSTVTQKATKDTTAHAAATERHAKAFDALGGSLRAAAGSFAPLAVVFGGYEFVKQAAEKTEELAHQTEILSSATALSSKRASQWIELGKQWGVSSSQVTVGFKAISKQIKAAEEGSTSSAKAFHALGIPLAELKNLKTEEVVGRISDAFSKMEDGPRKTALDTQLFGKSALALLPILNEGSKGLDEQLGKFQGLSKAQLEAAKSAIETQRDFSRAYDEIQVKVSFAMLSAGKSVAGWVKDIKEGRGQVAQTIADIGHILGPILKADIKTATEVFKNFGQEIKGVCELISGVIHLEFGKAWKGLEDIFTGGVKQVVALVKGMGRLLQPVIAGIGSALGGFFSDMWSGITDTFKSGANDVIGVLNDMIGIIDSGLGVVGIHIGKIGEIATGGSNRGSTSAGGKKHQSSAGYATGGKVDRPMIYEVGEEAPAHHEWVIASNPRYRQANLGYWAQAGHDLGVPGFAEGGLTGLATSFAENLGESVTHLPLGGGKSRDVAGAVLKSLPNPASVLPGWIAPFGSYLKDKLVKWVEGESAKASSSGSQLSGGQTATALEFAKYMLQAGFPRSQKVIAEGLGTIKSESNFAPNNAQGPSGHIGPWAESPAFGSVAQREDPLGSTIAAYKVGYAPTGSFWQAWGQWESAQSGLSGGGAGAYGPEYMAVAKQALSGGRRAGGRIPGFKAGGSPTAGASSVGPADSNHVISWAQHHLGNHDKWGYPGEWCGAFVGADMMAHGIEPPSGYPAAAAWGSWGTADSSPQYGDVVVIGGSGHVGLSLGGDQMISGNFSDEVAISSIAEAAGGRPITGYRRPPYAATSKPSSGSGTSAPSGPTPAQEARKAAEAAVGVGRGTPVGLPGLAAGTLSAAAKKLPRSFQALLRQPGLSFAEKLGIGQSALSAAEETEGTLTPSAPSSSKPSNCSSRTSGASRAG